MLLGIITLVKVCNIARRWFAVEEQPLAFNVLCVGDAKCVLQATPQRS